MMAMKVTDAELFESLEWLKDDEYVISKARARRIVLDEGRKNLKARLMAESGETAYTKQETAAYAHPDYRALLLRLEQAIKDDEHCRCLTDYHKARVEVWRSQCANQRVIDKVL